jgi:hypothetical protein
MLASLSFPPFEAGRGPKDKGCSASPIERGRVGTFRKDGRKHLSLYVAEHQFGYNNWENTDILGKVISAC